MKPIAIICIGVLALFGCRSLKDSYYGITDIHFGTGGGFSGIPNDNHIDSKGMVYHQEDYIKTLSEDEHRKVIATYWSLVSDTINDPGNIYYYIRVNDKEKTYNYVWSNKSNVKQELKDWYDQLMTFTKKSE